MSFGGHVQDMIQRGKQNRELLNLRRERAKVTRKQHVGKGNLTSESPITLEEFERIDTEIKKREQEQRRYFKRMTLVVLLCLVALLLLLWSVFSMVL